MSYIIILSSLLFSAAAMDSQETSTADHLDQYAIDHSHIVFHLYAQNENGDELDLGKSSESAMRLAGQTVFTIQRLALPEEMTQGWEHFPLYGLTGISILGEWGERRSLLGVISYNSSHNLVILACRGTQQFSDIWTNINFLEKQITLKDKTFLVHAGYAQALESMQSQLQEVMEDLKSKMSEDKIPLTRLVVTGHSMGGSIATLAAGFALHSNWFSRLELRIFGAPPVAYEDYSDWLRSEGVLIKSFHRKTDMARHIPSCWNYHIPGPLIELPHFGASWYNILRGHDVRLYRHAIKAHTTNNLTELEDGANFAPLFYYTINIFWGEEAF